MMGNESARLVPGAPLLDPDEKLTVMEAALLCSVSYNTFLGWVRKGVLPHLEIGPHNAIRVYRREVVKLIREATAG